MGQVIKLGAQGKKELAIAFKDSDSFVFLFQTPVM